MELLFIKMGKTVRSRFGLGKIRSLFWDTLILTCTGHVTKAKRNVDEMFAVVGTMSGVGVGGLSRSLDFSTSGMFLSKILSSPMPTATSIISSSLPTP